MDDSGLFEFDLMLERTIKTAKVNRVKKSVFEFRTPQPLRRSSSASNLARFNTKKCADKCTDSSEVKKLTKYDAFKKPDVEILLNNREKVNQFMKLLSNCELDQNLDQNVDPGLRRFYVIDYIKNKESLGELLFNLFNNHVFENKLPKTIKLQWSNKLTSTAGLWCHGKSESGTIVLAPRLLDTADKLRDTLIHEMCHAATSIITKEREVHGRFWRYWTLKANLEFSHLPVITRCHDYKTKVDFQRKLFKSQKKDEFSWR